MTEVQKNKARVKYLNTLLKVNKSGLDSALQSLRYTEALNWNTGFEGEIKIEKAQEEVRRYEDQIRTIEEMLVKYRTALCVA